MFQGVRGGLGWIGPHRGCLHADVGEATAIGLQPVLPFFHCQWQQYDTERRDIAVNAGRSRRWSWSWAGGSAYRFGQLQNFSTPQHILVMSNPQHRRAPSHLNAVTNKTTTTTFDPSTTLSIDPFDLGTPFAALSIYQHTRSVHTDIPLPLRPYLGSYTRRRNMVGGSIRVAAPSSPPSRRFATNPARWVPELLACCPRSRCHHPTRPTAEGSNG